MKLIDFMKTAAFIPVRLSSTRLPGKALINICGKPAIQYLIERVKSVKNLDGIVICTTTNPSDDKIIEFARQMKVNIFRGNEVDILDRFKTAALEFKVENIVNIDGDDILCEPEFIEQTAVELEKNKFDYIYWKNLPLGTTPIGIKTSALVKICNEKNTDNTETGWGRFFTQTDLFNVTFLTSNNPELLNSDIRLTLDYPEDLALFEQILMNLKWPFNLKDVVKLLNDRKDIKDLNKSVKDDYWKFFESKSAKIKMKKHL
jgi:spore coat polysaccharide biosynthesis protein SpsF